MEVHWNWSLCQDFPRSEQVNHYDKELPCMSDVHVRTIRDATTGRIIDECIVEDTPDDVLHRRLGRPRDIRVEITMKRAQQMFEMAGVDIAEIYSPLRIVQEAAMQSYHGIQLKPGCSST